MLGRPRIPLEETPYKYWEDLDRGQARYIVLYDGERTSEVYFAGLFIRLAFAPGRIVLFDTRAARVAFIVLDFIADLGASIDISNVLVRSISVLADGFKFTSPVLKESGFGRPSRAF
jgi:hypothetical protein